eukprot:TRINITY_DN15488_c0_g1_i1.p1 TRINITY_DN15488_c0_g1~~TRINITY_DN15488_c0_g1_i1.p1  ORF type:complete len:408 (+),score=90.76 TRINITY_DN15488_c0_g1_i1:87-1226(+)
MRAAAALAACAACASAVHVGVPGTPEPPAPAQRVIVTIRAAGAVNTCTASMASHLATALQGVARVVVLYDKTTLQGGEAQLTKIVHLFAPVDVYFATAQEVLDTYRNVRWPIPCLHHDLTAAARKGSGRHTCRPGGWYHTLRKKTLASSPVFAANYSLSVNAFIHEPLQVILMKHLQRVWGWERAPALMWKIEQDTVFMHDSADALRAFFKRYHPPTRVDFAAVKRSMGSKPTGIEAWRSTRQFRSVIPYTANAAFLKRYRTLSHKWEHVELYSEPFLTYLDKVLQEGAAAYGENFAGSVCLLDTDFSCSYRDFAEDGYVHPQHKCYAGGSVCDRRGMLDVCTSRDRRKDCEKEHKQFQGKWAHAFKDLCVASRYRSRT